jgi:hypothetical protein
MQDMLYAQDRWPVLLIFQAMDAKRGFAPRRDEFFERDRTRTRQTAVFSQDLP